MNGDMSTWPDGPTKDMDMCNSPGNRRRGYLHPDYTDPVSGTEYDPGVVDALSRKHKVYFIKGRPTAKDQLERKQHDFMSQ